MNRIEVKIKGVVIGTASEDVGGWFYDFSPAKNHPYITQDYPLVVLDEVAGREVLQFYTDASKTFAMTLPVETAIREWQE